MVSFLATDVPGNTMTTPQADQWANGTDMAAELGSKIAIPCEVTSDGEIDSLFYIILTLVADMLNAWLDPRIRVA